MNVVLDTNVLISGLLIPDSKPGYIIQLVVSNHLKLCYDARIIAEYYNVMSRPKFGFNKKHIRDLLFQIKLQGDSIIAERLSLELVDPDDLKFVEVAITSKVKYLITGNVKHYPLKKNNKLEIITPSNFLVKI